MEQLAARRAHNPKVVGSSPTPATRFIKDFIVLDFFMLCEKSGEKTAEILDINLKNLKSVI